MANKISALQSLIDKEYKPGLTLITPTRNRNEIFKRCEFYIKQQTVKFNQWIIADDSEEYLIPTMNQVHIKNKYPGHKAESINHNVRSCLKYVEYDRIAIIEDDDCYKPNYLEHLLERLESYDLAGEGCSFYYHIKNCRYKQNNNTKHSSLYQTGLRTIPAIEHLYVSTLRKQSAFLDSRLWNKKLKKFVFCDGITAIGIKGHVKNGIGMGHRLNSSFHIDKDFKVLKQKMKSFPSEYVDFYIQLNKELNK